MFALRQLTLRGSLDKPFDWGRGATACDGVGQHDFYDEETT